MEFNDIAEVPAKEIPEKEVEAVWASMKPIPEQPTDNDEGVATSSARKARARRRYISPPTNLVLIPTSDKVTLEWGLSTGLSIDGYTILRDGEEIGDVPAQFAGVYDDNGVQSETSYTYSIYAYNGFGGKSAMITGQTTTLADLP